MKSTNDGCWTCRGAHECLIPDFVGSYNIPERKIRCGLQRPTCANCARSSRVCHGWGFRLAWPKDNDRRRARTALVPPKCDDRRRWSKIRFVDVSSQDIALFFEFADYEGAKPQVYRKHCRARVRRLPLSTPMSWDLFDERARAPLQHFMSSGTQFFSATHGDVLSPLVLRFGLSDSSASSKAVLHSLLALSCSHLRRNEEASSYRSSAVTHLSSALDANCGVKASFQNIAASMLLCVFEVSFIDSLLAILGAHGR
jgi:hypothetical protein